MRRAGPTHSRPATDATWPSRARTSSPTTGITTIASLDSAGLQGDGSGTACPCGNSSTLGSRQGCQHSLGTGGLLRGAGTASIAADSVVLEGTLMPNSFALYFQGTGDVAGGAGVVFGDGLRCAGGNIIRLGTKMNTGGTSRYPAAGDPPISIRGGVTVPGERTYQIWFRNAAAFCTAATFNLTNGVRFTWTL